MEKEVLIENIVKGIFKFKSEKELKKFMTKNKFSIEESELIKSDFEGGWNNIMAYDFAKKFSEDRLIKLESKVSEVKALTKHEKSRFFENFLSKMFSLLPKSVVNQ